MTISRIQKHVHKSATGLAREGLIDERTMSEFNRLCTETDETPDISAMYELVLQMLEHMSAKEFSEDDEFLESLQTTVKSLAHSAFIKEDSQLRINAILKSFDIKRSTKQKVAIDFDLRPGEAVAVNKMTPLTPEEIQHMRQKYQLTQHAFALYLNTKTSTVQKWEAGEATPKGISLKLLDLVKRNGIRILAS